MEDGRLEIASNEIFAHENYNGLSIRNDIALVHLPEPVQFTGQTDPAFSLVESFITLKYFHDVALSHAIKNQLEAPLRVSGALSWFFMA